MSKKMILLAILPLVAIAVAAPLDDQPPEIVASDAEQAGGHFEGDIILTETQENAVQDGRTALIGPNLKWPDSTVYYVFAPNHFSLSQQTSIVKALEQVSLASCVKFVQRTAQKDYVNVTGEYTGCWSYLGRIGGGQQLNLQPNGCMSTGTIIHEFLHALGFVHMQSASDRDFYITIDWSAIQSGRAYNFDRYSSKAVNDFGIAYDYDSVMHYGATAFSANGRPTIIPKEPNVSIGQRVGMSYKDIKRLNSLYCTN